MISSHVIEFRDTSRRAIILNTRFGSFTLHLDEVQELIDALLQAQERALDPTALPEPEPNPFQPKPRKLSASTPTTLEELA